MCRFVRSSFACSFARMIVSGGLLDIEPSHEIERASFLLEATFPGTVRSISTHGWKDASLKELCALIKRVNEDARRRNATLEFSSWYVINAPCDA